VAAAGTADAAPGPLAWDGQFSGLEAHLVRFAASLARLRLDPGYEHAQIEAVRDLRYATPVRYDGPG